MNLSLYKCILFRVLFFSNSIKAAFIDGRYTKAISDYEVILPRKVKSNGAFHSFQLPHSFEEHLRRKKRSITEDDHVHYKITFNDVDHYLHLVPNARLTSPGMVVENRHGPNISNHRITAPRSHLCHYHGHIKGLNNSKVAVSTCSGITGVIATGNSSYYIEPLDEADQNGEHLHIVYKKSLAHPDSHMCQTRSDWWNAWAEEMYRTMKENKTRTMRSDARHVVPRYMKCCVISDLKFIEHHKSRNIEEYVLTIMNIVSNYYHDESIGNLIDVVVVRLVYLHKEKEEVNLDISPKASQTLDSFCKWQLELNPKEVTHPNHHDLAVLLTRHDVCSSTTGSCGLLGLAYLGTACNPQRACSINEDTGLMLGVTVAHEMGHNMGCYHDLIEESGCNGTLPDGSGTVMDATVGTVTTIWSNCSRNFITNLLQNQLGECLLDEPKDHNYLSQEMPAGAIYDGNQQCKFAFGDNYSYCKLKGDKVCEKLYCKEIGKSRCLSFGHAIADGTNCGQNKWCYQKKCLPIGERPAAVDGGWSEWSSWTECTRTCGGGVSMRQRICDTPMPKNGGRYCIGMKHDYQICSTQDCEYQQPTFREVQCTEQNDIPFNDNKYKWIPYLAPESDPNPCSLYCLNEKKTLAKLQERVKDGTRCNLGSKDTCIHGVCIPVGCDWIIYSHAVEDICGVCNGDGSHCKLVNGTFTPKKGSGYVKVTTIPKGSVNIDIEELGASENILAVGSAAEVYFNANNSEKKRGEYRYGGVLGLYTKPEVDREEIHIKGPTKEDFILYYVFFKNENPGVQYMYALTTAEAVISPLYHWEYVDWGPCSARCGGGSEISKPSCIEQTRGKVKETLCDPKDKPEPKTRTCNSEKCRTKWKTWGWGPCSGCLSKAGERVREVECVMEPPSFGDGDEIIVNETECFEPKPVTKELCNSSKPCDTTASNVKSVSRLKEWNNDLGEDFYKFIYDTSGVENFVRNYYKRSNKHWLKTRSNETSIPIIEDKIDPKNIVLHIANESEYGNEIFNLSETEFESVGEKVPLFSIKNESVLVGEKAIDMFRNLTVSEKPRNNRANFVDSSAVSKTAGNLEALLE